MEITSAQITDFANRAASGNSNIAHSLNVGDILVLRIQAMDGGSLLFSDHNGSYLVANTADGAGLNLGDTVEMMVSGASDNQYSLKILDVMPKTTQTDMAAAGELAARGEKTGLAKAPSMAVLTTAMTMMKQNADIPPKLARFMAANHMVPSAEQVETLNQMISAQGQTGALLYEVLTELAEQLEPQAMMMESETNQPAEPANGGPTQAESAPAQHIGSEKRVPQNTQKTEAKPQALPMQTETEPLPQETAGKTPQARPAPKMAHIQSLLKSVWDMDAPETIKADEDLPLKQVLTKVLATFYSPDEPQNAKTLKKTIGKVALQLKELKVLLDSNDIKNKETFLVKVGQAEKQTDTLNEVKQLNCFHIPIWLENRPATTGELYVYQRQKNASHSKKKGLTALLGIDTPNLGRVEAMIGLDRQCVAMDIGVEREDVLAAFEKNQDILAVTLETLGYQMASFKAGILEARTTVLNADERLAEHAQVSNDRLDVRI